MKNITCLLFVLMFISCTPRNMKKMNLGGMPMEPGKCFAKCISASSAIVDPGVTLAIYTGSDPSSVNLITKSIQTKEGKQGWVKKKADRNCLSADPNDCLVWCLVNEPPEYQEITYLADTTQTKEFELQQFGVKYDEDTGNIWMETLCHTEIDAVVAELQTALVKNGAHFLPLSGEFDAKTKTALVAYQKEAKLCVGQLTIESLDALGVSY